MSKKTVFRVVPKHKEPERKDLKFGGREGDSHSTLSFLQWLLFVSPLFLMLGGRFLTEDLFELIVPIAILSDVIAIPFVLGWLWYAWRLSDDENNYVSRAVFLALVWLMVPWATATISAIIMPNIIYLVF